MPHLSALLAQPDLARLAARLAARAPAPDRFAEDQRRAAVAAVLRVTDQPELLFIKRADRPGDPWSGHIAFPGGRHDPTDASLEDTAVRETMEELSLDLTQGHLLGQLDDLQPYTRALPPIVIRPFVAVVPADVTLVPSDEVADAFWIPLAALRMPSARIAHAMLVNGVPAHFPAFAAGPHVVWGLTERMLSQLLSLLES